MPDINDRARGGGSQANRAPKTFPWIGQIKPWSAALRARPHKNPHEPSQGILADLPRSTRVTVVSQQGGWLRVQVTLASRMREGYVSQELVEYVSTRPSTSPRSATPTAAPAKRRLFFAIYYRVKDQAFKRAADTWERESRQAFQFKDGVDLFLSIEVGSESEFKAAWKRIHSESRGKFATVVQGQIFSHASKSGNGEQNGLEFTKDTDEDGTLLRAEIESLAPLNWDSRQGHLILSGCNSGLMGSRQWSPAEIFARTQEVMTTGQRGYAYFSPSPDKYVEINNNSTTVYLWAFKRRRNGWAGDGGRMDSVIFNP
jgi:hypothetical protein